MTPELAPPPTHHRDHAAPVYRVTRFVSTLLGELPDLPEELELVGIYHDSYGERWAVWRAPYHRGRGGPGHAGAGRWGGPRPPRLPG